MTRPSRPAALRSLGKLTANDVPEARGPACALTAFRTCCARPSPMALRPRPGVTPSIAIATMIAVLDFLGLTLAVRYNYIWTMMLSLDDTAPRLTAAL